MGGCGLRNISDGKRSAEKVHIGQALKNWPGQRLSSNISQIGFTGDVAIVDDTGCYCFMNTVLVAS